MKDNYLLIGTAGHVDHGKTQLIQALTGISTDRLKEEKERGISIELGFAHLTLPGGRKAGIVDVPGHERFIRQMLAGASGMDVVLLVVAADEGVMPQTQEHLDILELLQIKNGIIVITKVDLVDDEWLMLVQAEIKERTKGTFMENSPILAVSSVTHQGITELVEMIDKILGQVEVKRLDLPPRMPIDRVFTIQGFGTVVTGTMHSGIFVKGQEVSVEPGGITTKIRNIQIHSDWAGQVSAGQRAAINVSGLAVKEIERGMNLVQPRYFPIGQILDIELFNLTSEKRVMLQRQRIHFYLGTSENIGRIHLLDREELLPGDKAFAQVILEKPVLAAYGDRFVVRYYSPVTTIGGGTVLGVATQKRKRFREKGIEELRLKAQGSIREIIQKTIMLPLSLQEIAKATGLEQADIQQELNKMEENAEVIVLMEDQQTLYWLQKQALEWGNHLGMQIANYQKKYPLRGGMGREELKGKVNVQVNHKRWVLMLAWGEKNGFYRITNNRLEAQPEISLPAKLQKQVDFLVDAWQRAGLNLPDKEEIRQSCALQVEGFEEIAGYLVMKGLWVSIADHYFSVTAVEQAKNALQGYLTKNDEITVAQARDLWQISRKYAVPLLEYFDSQHITKRLGLVRHLV